MMDRFVDSFYVVRKVRSAGAIAASATIKLWTGGSAEIPRPNVFNGEFDSGSERTLAAWIRHASRTGTFLVAIPKEV